MLGNITNITDIYSMKVQRIEGQIDEEADWIGQIDPYVKFQAANRTLYETQKLDGAGGRPVWACDHFHVLLPTPNLTLKVYDDDLIGKDDYLG